MTITQCYRVAWDLNKLPIYYQTRLKCVSRQSADASAFKDLCYFIGSKGGKHNRYVLPTADIDICFLQPSVKH